MKMTNHRIAPGMDNVGRNHDLRRCSEAVLLTVISSLFVACGGGASESSGTGSAAVACVTGPGPGATLDWNAVAGAAGYRIYSRTASGNFSLLQDVTGGNVTTLAVNGLSSGTTYYFAATAYDSSNPPIESSFSNLACKAIS